MGRPLAALVVCVVAIVALLRPASPPDTSLAGRYENHEYDVGGKNDWHFVTLERTDNGALRWSNRAGVSWLLSATDDANLFRIGDDSPYWGEPGQQDLRVYRDARGVVLCVTGPGGELYHRKAHALLEAFDDRPTSRESCFADAGDRAQLSRNSSSARSVPAGSSSGT
ncbi:MAG: hypothetical protein AAF460_00670 [Pseudomonadota bacterium]